MCRTAIRTIMAVAIVYLIGFVSPARSIDIQYLNSTLWSDVNQVCVRDNYAYCAMQHGFKIFDISDVSNPVEIGKHFLDGGTGADLVFVGSYAYLASGDAGLKIFDISDIANPQLVGAYEREYLHALHVCVEGNYAYVSGIRREMDIVDISNPSAPVQVGYYEGLNDLFDMSVMGNYLVAANLFQMQIIDISNPASPFLETTYEPGPSTRALDVRDTLAFTLDESMFHVVNLADPAQPQTVASAEVGFFSYNVRQMKIIGDYAYTAHGPYSTSDGSGGVVIIDISDPTLPTVDNHLQDSVQLLSRLGAGLGLSEGFSEYQLNDLTDPIHPAPVGSLRFPEFSNWGSRDVATDGNYAYVAFGPSGVQIVDVHDPANPEPLTGDLLPGEAVDLELRNRMLYVASGASGAQGLQIIDVSSPTEPVVIGYYEYSSPNVITLSGNYAFMGGQSTNGIILNISDPTEPELVSTYSPAGNTWGIAVRGDYAYLANRDGLVVVDISDISNPAIVDMLFQDRRFLDVAICNGFLVAGGSDFVTVYDIASPAAPAEIAEIPFSYHVNGLTVYGNYVMVATTWDGFNIIDMSVPTSPVLAATQPYSGDARAVAFFDEHAFVVDYCGFVSYAVDLPTCCFTAGDVNFDSRANISDAVAIIDRVFRGGLPPTCPASADANCNGENNISDAVTLINWVFKGGPAPCCP